jgi:hypothetical protein
MTIYAMTKVEELLKMRVCTIMHDGFMVYGDHYDKEKSVCKLLQDALKDEYKIKMPYAMKKHDDLIKNSVEITPPPDNYERRSVGSRDVVNSGLYLWAKDKKLGFKAWMSGGPNRNEGYWGGVVKAIGNHPERLTKTSDFLAIHGLGQAAVDTIIKSAPDDVMQIYDAKVPITLGLDTINRALMNSIHKQEPETSKRLRAKAKFVRLGLSEIEKHEELSAVERELHAQAGHLLLRHGDVPLRNTQIVLLCRQHW